MSAQSFEDASWQCNGIDIFTDGCKSGQTTFALHLDTKAWGCYQTSEGSDADFEEQVSCDFDICEMCVRWTLYCEKTGTFLNLKSV